MLRCFHVISIAVFASASLATAQISVGGGPATQPANPTTAPAEKSAADAAFEPLKKAFSNIGQSLQNAGGLKKDDEATVRTLRAMRDRAAAFSREFPSDLRGPAIELQISMWLRDDDLVNDLYRRIEALAPDNPDIPLSHAQYAINHNDYATAIDVLNKHTFDAVKTPNAYILLSDALFAEEKFAEAAEALKRVPQEVLDKDVMVKVQVDEKLKPREEYPALWSAERELREKEKAADDLPLATIKTARGEITLELFENQAPNTVANFISLAEKKFYDGTKFHRVLPNFMAQGGDPNSKEGATGIPGQGDPGYYIPDEIAREDSRKHFTGSLAMAKTSAPNTGGCQFYITVTPTTHLNGVHTVFGRVLSGREIVRDLEQNDVVESITITRKRDHAYVPATLPLPGAATQPATQATTQISTDPATTAPADTQPETMPATTQP